MCVCAPWVLGVSVISLLSIFLMCHSFNVCVCSVGSWGQYHIFAFNIPVSFLPCVCVCSVGSCGQFHIFAFNIPDVSFLPCVCVCSVGSWGQFHIFAFNIPDVSFLPCVCVLREFLGSVSYLCFQYS